MRRVWMVALCSLHAAGVIQAAGEGSGRAPGGAGMSGTVASIDRTPRELGVITGVGHALRLLVFEVDSDCRIVIEGVEASFEELERGAKVKVLYRTARIRPVATQIQIIRPRGGES